MRACCAMCHVCEREESRGAKQLCRGCGAESEDRLESLGALRCFATLFFLSACVLCVSPPGRSAAEPAFFSPLTTDLLSSVPLLC